ncbi:MAG TPA: 30S ribosomal protein S18 [Candidatus Acidoferrum sp.]|nr:30S ribosomal protein S18 [Candidatus Acidoferrum sp.]
MADEQAPQSPAAPAAPSAPSGQPPAGHGGPGGPGRFGPGGPRPQGGRPGGPGGPRRGKRSFVRKKKVCRFCVDKSDYIDYKKAEILAPFLQERGKILPRRMTGTCARHQRWLTVAIKRAQNIALLPFAAEL